MKRLWQIGNIISLAFALAANYLVGAQVLNLPSISEISDKYSTLLTPAGYAFSIWSLIYILLVVFVVYQARDLIKPSKDNKIPQQIGPFFILASIFNGLWAFLFVNEMVLLSVITLLALTISLYLLLWRLGVAKFNPPFATIACVWWPLMIYTGWVTVASVVNVASWWESINVTLSPLATIFVLIGLALVLLVLLVKSNVRELLLASIWGIAAVGVQQIQQTDSLMVAIAAFVIAGLLLIAVIAHAYVNRRSNPIFKLIQD